MATGADLLHSTPHGTVQGASVPLGQRSTHCLLRCPCEPLHATREEQSSFLVPRPLSATIAVATLLCSTRVRCSSFPSALLCSGVPLPPHRTHLVDSSACVASFLYIPFPFSFTDVRTSSPAVSSSFCFLPWTARLPHRCTKEFPSRDTIESTNGIAYKIQGRHARATATCHRPRA